LHENGRRTDHSDANLKAAVTDVEADNLVVDRTPRNRVVRAASSYHVVSNLETGRTNGSFLPNGGAGGRGV
jgi:hypothetical protein